MQETTYKPITLVQKGSNLYDPRSIMARLQREIYALPGDPTQDLYIIPVSGGADSAALAILMRLLFPNHMFVLVFTDTLAEDVEVYVTLDKLEEFLGLPIDRVVPDLGLFELIDEYNGFLPSHQKRYCTRVLKLENFQPWLAQHRGRTKHMFVGIRSDENSRLAFTIDEVETHMPFIDLGLRRHDIYAILQATIGIPRYYQRRTRSGCSNCFFQRRTELVGLLLDRPLEFDKGAKRERVPESDLLRHSPAPALSIDTGIAANWFSLPLPKDRLAMPGVRKTGTKGTPDLFGNRGIYVAGEFFYDGMPGLPPFIWHQRVISYSTTESGIARQIDGRYQHLLDTAEVYDMTPDDVRRDVKFVIWYVELPVAVFDPSGPSSGSYTWSDGESYVQIRHIIGWVQRALFAERLREESAMICNPMGVVWEWKESAIEALQQLQHPVGALIASRQYVPKEEVLENSVEEEAKLTPCPMCSI